MERGGGLKGEEEEKRAVTGINISKCIMYMYKDAMMKHYYI